jgi:DNA-binding response OmpR family regulator
MAKILIVDDDENLVEQVADHLTRNGFTVESATNGLDGLQLVEHFPFDVLVLDWRMPGLTGIELCKKYRDLGGKAGILMLTGKDSIDDKETGFNTGVDDYLTKPFDARELVVRIRALLRRGGAVKSDVLHAGNVSLNTRSRTVTVSGAALSLTPKEYALLELLMRSQDQAFTCEELRDHVWPSYGDVSLDTVRTLVHRLRQRLPNDADAPSIANVAGLGYKLQLPGER